MATKLTPYQEIQKRIPNAGREPGNPKNVLKEFGSTLKPGGLLLLTTPRTKGRITPILKKHLGSLSCWKAWHQFLPRIIPLAAAAIFNLVICRKSRKRTANLCGQSWLAVAMKPDSNGL